MNIIITENQRLIDMLKSLRNHSEFNAYITKLQNIEDLPYAESKYYLEQIKETILSYDDRYGWKIELATVDKLLLLLKKHEENKIEIRAENEPLKLFWNSFKIWTEEELPNSNILNQLYLRFDPWKPGKYMLDIDMSKEFTKEYGLIYDNRYDDGSICFDDLKLYLELFYKKFVNNRYEYTKEINVKLQKFNLPYKLNSGRLRKKGYFSSKIDDKIINFPMLERKIQWSEEKIMCQEKLDKHTALNYITDSLQFILSLIKNGAHKDKKIEQAAALIVSCDEDSKVYSVVKNEVAQINMIVNEYFDIRHNEYINKAKENRTPLTDVAFIEYLYNRIYSLVQLVKINYVQNIENAEENVPF